MPSAVQASIHDAIDVSVEMNAFLRCIRPYAYVLTVRGAGVRFAGWCLAVKKGSSQDTPKAQKVDFDCEPRLPNCDAVLIDPLIQSHRLFTGNVSIMTPRDAFSHMTNMGRSCAEDLLGKIVCSSGLKHGSNQLTET